MKSGNSSPDVTGLCWFMVRRLPPLISAFTKEIDGVRAAEDIEYIHRMRVASRRLRAALPLFRTCFPPREYARWMSSITRITRALGDARDADVQIAYLKKYLKRRDRDTASQPEGAVQGHSGVPAARYLLVLLEEHRQQLQEPVNKALDALEKSGVVAEMQEVFREQETRVRAHRRIPPLQAIPMIAARRVSKRLSSLLHYEPWLSHPEAVAEHHATRIAAKRLRYTLEIYGPAYQNGLNKYLLRVKKIQEILGDLHDCDVWIDRVTTIRLKERTLLRSEKVNLRPGPDVLMSLNIFLSEKEKERRAIYRRFTRYWASLNRGRTWQELRAALLEKRRKRFRPQQDGTENAARRAVELLASSCPEILSHSRTVTALALQLFDSLQSLHKLGTHDRFLLECAGILHDIGWMGGQDDHHRRGAQIIMADEHIPFDLPERGTIALAVSCHRGRRSPADDPLFLLLSPEYQQKAMAITALLRVADGLDLLHTGNVREIHCIPEKESVLCDIVAGSDCMAEKEHARAKADLFGRIFDKPLVIR